MNIFFGSQKYENVTVPLLWGERAVISHPNGKVSIIDLGGNKARPEIVEDTPWNNVEFTEKEDGYVIYKNDNPVLFFSPPRKIIRDMAGTLPECKFTDNETKIGTNVVSNSMISGFDVGIGVTEQGMFIGGPLPSELADIKTL